MHAKFIQDHPETKFIHCASPEIRRENFQISNIQNIFQKSETGILYTETVAKVTTPTREYFALLDWVEGYTGLRVGFWVSVDPEATYAIQVGQILRSGSAPELALYYQRAQLWNKIRLYARQIGFTYREIHPHGLIVSKKDKNHD